MMPYQSNGRTAFHDARIMESLGQSERRNPLRFSATSCLLDQRQNESNHAIARKKASKPYVPAGAHKISIDCVVAHEYRHVSVRQYSRRNQCLGLSSLSN